MSESENEEIKPKMEGQTVEKNPDSGKWSYTDKDDNVVYEYDKKLKAWFPLLDEDIINTQQSVYEMEEKKIVKVKEKKIDFKNTSIYITGLPKDISLGELIEAFEKYGVIMEDIITNEKKIKIYRDEEGNCKGDALITYFKEESVELAINLLDESRFRPNDDSILRVQKADFSINKKNNEKKIKLDPKFVKKKRDFMERKLDWREKDYNKRADKIIILKNMFTIKEIEDNPALLIELKEDIRSECEKLGEVSNIIIYDKSEEGVCKIKFKQELSALACIKLMNGRFFAQRRISAELYDGVTKYKKSSNKESNETEEVKERLENYAKWLESREN